MKITKDKDGNIILNLGKAVPVASAKVSSTGKTKTLLHETATVQLEGQITKMRISWYIPLANGDDVINL